MPRQLGEFPITRVERRLPADEDKVWLRPGHFLKQPRDHAPVQFLSRGCLVLLIGFLFLARALAGLFPGHPPSGAHGKDRAVHTLARSGNSLASVYGAALE